MNFQDAMMGALKGRGNVAEAFREMVARGNDLGLSDVATVTEVATALDQWRPEAMAWVEELPKGEERAERLKSLNNQAGYVNTLCKKHLGYSVKYDRKLGEYLFEVYTKPEKAPEGEKSEDQTGAEGEPGTRFETALLFDARDLKGGLEALVAEHGVETVAIAVLEMSENSDEDS